MLSKMTLTDRHYIGRLIFTGRYLQDKTNLRGQRNWLRDCIGFLATSRREFQLMLMIDDMVRSCSNTRGINRVFIRCLFFFFFFVGNLFWGDKGCFIFHRRQFLLRHSQKTFIKIRYYFVLLHLGVQWSI